MFLVRAKRILGPRDRAKNKYKQKFLPNEA